jgi:hypothetical protein
MRLVVLITLIAALGVVMLAGFLRLVRELIGKDFFQAPSISVDAANRAQDMERDDASHSANLTS